MLIKDRQLDMEVFKSEYQNWDWRKVPRKLNEDIKEFFFVANYQDDFRIISVKIRPSMRMALTESFKNRDLNGNEAPEGTKVPNNKFKYDYGSTVTVLIDDNFLDKIKEIAKTPEANTIQKVSL